jgi:hypothetical protein
MFPKYVFFGRTYNHSLNNVNIHQPYDGSFGEYINLETIGDVILRDICAFAKYIMNSPKRPNTFSLRSSYSQLKA